MQRVTGAAAARGDRVGRPGQPGHAERAGDAEVGVAAEDRQAERLGAALEAGMMTWRAWARSQGAEGVERTDRLRPRASRRGRAR